MPTDQEAAELWIAFKKGDRAAYASLVREFYKLLLNYGTKLSQDTSLVQDCIQDLFLEIWQRREFLGETDYVKFYLLKSLRRKIHFEKKKLSNWQEDADYESQIADFVGEFSVEADIIANETVELHQQKLKKVMKKLSKREREVIYLKFYQEMDNQQIADMMSINYQSVRNLVYTAIGHLKSAWQKP